MFSLHLLQNIATGTLLPKVIFFSFNVDGLDRPKDKTIGSTTLVLPSLNDFE